jgi:hypothetical protein
VSQSAQSGRIAISFRVGTHSTTRPFVDVQLAVEIEEMFAVESGARLRVEEKTSG